jgi:hypothetical protein
VTPTGTAKRNKEGVTPFGSPFAIEQSMSKQHPNQDFYKIGGSGQSDGPDRGDSIKDDKERLVQMEKDARHPAVRRTAKKK